MRALILSTVVLPLSLLSTQAELATDTLPDILAAETNFPPKAEIIEEYPNAHIIIPAERETIARVQIFLDQQNLAPGVIDGKMGTFTQMAINAYHNKFGHADTSFEKIAADANSAVSDLYATAIVPSAATKFVDQKFLDNTDREYQASREDMPYRSIAEFMAERYHTSVGFLQLINGKETMDKITVLSAIRVPNIKPFKIESMAAGRTYKEEPTLSARWAVVDTTKNQLRIYEPLTPAAGSAPVAVTLPDAPNISDNAAENATGDYAPGAMTARALIVEDDPQPEQELTQYDEHRAELVAAFPITTGKPEFIRRGTWTMRNSIEFPTWRFDDALLKTGQRSNVSLTIPAGPNNPVGVHWMGLSRPGIGMHGTDNPDNIGRGLSSGCIRLANWDVVKVPSLLRPGATVIIK